MSTLVIIPPTPVPAVTPVPPFPPLSDRVLGLYNIKAFNFGNHMGTVFMPELQALCGSAYSNAQAANVAATIATAMAAASASAVGADKWVMGTNYPADVTAWSPIDKQTYRRNAPGGISNVDPSIDSGGSTSGWTRISGGDSLPQFLLSTQGIV